MELEHTNSFTWRENAFGDKLLCDPTPEQAKALGFPADVRLEIIKSVPKGRNQRTIYYLAYWIGGYGSRPIPQCNRSFSSQSNAAAAMERILGMALENA